MSFDHCSPHARPLDSLPIDSALCSAGSRQRAGNDRSSPLQVGRLKTSDTSSALGWSLDKFRFVKQSSYLACRNQVTSIIPSHMRRGCSHWVLTGRAGTMPLRQSGLYKVSCHKKDLLCDESHILPQHMVQASRKGCELSVCTLPAAWGS